MEFTANNKKPFFGIKPFVKLEATLQKGLSDKFPNCECLVKTEQGRNGIAGSIKVTLTDKESGHKMEFKVLKGKAGICNLSHNEDKSFYVKLKHVNLLSEKEHTIAKTIGESVVETLGKKSKEFKISEFKPKAEKKSDKEMQPYRELKDQRTAGKKRSRSETDDFNHREKKHKKHE